MPKLVINGGKPLNGAVKVSGRKNSAVAVIPATLLVDGSSTLENLPRIEDVNVYLGILRALGAAVDSTSADGITVDPAGLDCGRVPFDLVKRLRASYYLLGALLARFGRAEVALPGGCDLGPRPIDQHLKGFRALGAKVTLERGTVKVRASRLVGAPVYFDIVSVGATVNVMLAATLAEGTTIIENAAKEPHIVDLANFLNAAGARVRGAGTDIIKITGVKSLRGCNHAIIPDEIEAATLLMAGVGTGGDVTVENVIPKHLDPITAKLRESGAFVEENGEWVRAVGEGRPRPANLKTMPYPGYPTDAMPPMTALLSIAGGTSLVSEGIWDNRFKHADELKKMGADIRVEGRTAVIEGVEHLEGAPVEAKDLRAGAALLVAGAMAEGETEIYGVEHLDRGYERTEEKFRALGAEIRRAE